MTETVADSLGKLLSKIRDKSARVGVVGMGYVGVPFAVEKAKVGYQVTGIEQNTARVDKINRGISYIDDVTSEDLAPHVKSGLIRAVDHFDCVSELDVLVVAVPTPLTKNLTPDLQYVEKVSREIAKRLKPGQLVSLESTTYPGTTEELMLPILETSGLKADKDFFLAHSPERVDPGNRRYTTKNTNKIVGGIGPASHEAAVTFYSQTIEKVVQVNSAKAAEMVKVFENTFRAVNIALVNELTLLCDRMGLSVWEVLDAAFTKPFGIMPFYPGPGVGGHCIPLDPHYLEWKAKEFGFDTHFIALASEINRSMPEFVHRKTIRVLNQCGLSLSQSRILVLGVSYKKDIRDHRESPARQIIDLLRASGAEVAYHDPHVPVSRQKDATLESMKLTDSLLEEHDLTLILTDHSSVDYNQVVRHSKIVFDTRNATRKVEAEREKIILL